MTPRQPWCNTFLISDCESRSQKQQKIIILFSVFVLICNFEVKCFQSCQTTVLCLFNCLMWEMFAKCLGMWRNAAIYWLIKAFCNLVLCTILTFSHPRKMSFDMSSFTVFDYLNTAIYLCFRSIYVQITALTTTTTKKSLCMWNMHRSHESSAWLELHNCIFSSKNGCLTQGNASLKPWLKVHISVKYSNVNPSFQSENGDLHIW